MIFRILFSILIFPILSLAAPTVTKCQKQESQEVLLGGHVLKCHDDGSFERHQCHGSTGHCWCVDPTTGMEINGTRSEPGGDFFDCYGCSYEQLIWSQDHVQPGEFIPQCTDEGRYERRQCHSSKGQCWCVNPRNGIEVPGTRTDPGKYPVSCDRPCFKTLSHVLIRGVFVGQAGPRCTRDGYFQSLQCMRTGHCWCVKPETGEWIKGTETQPMEEPKCDRIGPCHLAIRAEMGGSHPTFTSYVPQCADDGTFNLRQCEGGENGHCWCVHPQSGKEISGTLSKPGEEKANCMVAKPQKEKEVLAVIEYEPTMKSEEAEVIQLLISRELDTEGSCHQVIADLKKMGNMSERSYIPQCNPDGTFKNKQCDSDSGHCWCAHSSGEMIEGTEAMASKVQCKHFKFGPCHQRRSEILHLNETDVNAFIPRCRDDGTYHGQQCDPVTGQCWCVHRRTGEKIIGTSSDPSEPRLLCDHEDAAEVDDDEPKPVPEPEPEPTAANKSAKKPFAEPKPAAEPKPTAGKPVAEPRPKMSKSKSMDMDASDELKLVAPVAVPEPAPSEKSDKMESSESNEMADVLLDGIPACHRVLHELTLKGETPIGAYVPQCTDEGQFESRQCHSSTGYCWCVDAMSGRELENTKTRPGEAMVKCNDTFKESLPSEAVLKHEASDVRIGAVVNSSPGSIGGCYQILNDLTLGKKAVGSFVPQCMDDGSFEERQCHGSTGQCWCVDTITGKEAKGTRSGPGEPRIPCDITPVVPDHGMKEVLEALDVSSKELQELLPTNMTSTQLMPAVNSSQTEMVNETISGGCTAHAFAVTKDGAPPGAFIPQCDDEGNYTPLQCHGSTGQCWCVDSKGDEVEDTRTGPGEKPTDCPRILPFLTAIP